MKGRTLRANRAIGTGILKCGYCESRFYYRDQKCKTRNDGTVYIYPSYYHTLVMSGKKCGQKPKTVHSEHINEIYKLFFFYLLLVFDDTNELKKESLQRIKQIKIKLKENIENNEKEIINIENILIKNNKRLEKTDDEDVVYVVSKIIRSNENKLSELIIELSKMKIEYEKQNNKFDQTENEITYYDVKERILKWFKKLNIEEQRNELIKIIKNCNIYGHYILIDTGRVIFFFDIDQHYIFDKRLLRMLDKDQIYKLYFIKLGNKKLVKMYNDKKIIDIDLKKDDEIGLRLFKYLKKNFGVVYDLTEIKNFVSFVSLKGLYSQE
jgi:hypothetical protein